MDPTIYGTRATGRENMIIYHHRACGWRDEPRRLPYAMVNECPQCRGRNVLAFVRYEAGIEEKAAERLVNE
jgi:hypothetical protein